MILDGLFPGVLDKLWIRSQLGDNNDTWWIILAKGCSISIYYVLTDPYLHVFLNQATFLWSLLSLLHLCIKVHGHWREVVYSIRLQSVRLILSGPQTSGPADKICTGCLKLASGTWTGTKLRCYMRMWRSLQKEVSRD